MLTQPTPYVSPEEYLVRERQAETKSEYFHGEVFAMAGASATHVLMVSNLVMALGSQLRQRDCRVYASDLRVKVSPTGLYTYPDVVVVCGPPRFEDEHDDTLLNPKVVVEVLSPSTEDYDRGRKFAHYRTIESLVEYVLLAQERPHVEQFVRQADSRWVLSETDDMATRIELTSLGVVLALADAYDKVEFGPM